ncbi:MAG: AraC family transcriptional regulator, partial [Oscillospiraceae bacterium]
KLEIFQKLLYNSLMKKDFMLSHNMDKYTKPILFHSHDYFEIYFFAAGSVKYYVENEDYELKKGDVLIIPHGKLHRPVIEDNSPYERYVLWIFNSYLTNNDSVNGLIDEINELTKEKNTCLVSFDTKEQSSIKKLLDKALENYTSKEKFSEYISESCIMLILDELRKMLRSTDKAEYEQSDIIRQVIVYLNENFSNSPSLDELSAEFFLSKYYLSHRFKEHTKTTIHNYILMKKTNLAKELLKKGESPQSVSEKCGFSTYSNFYKAFIERTGISPSNYK